MNKTVRPEMILDVRVSVPYAVGGEPVPTFEVGKSYRTRKGDVVKIVKRTNSHDYPLRGEYHNQSWTLDGRYWTQAKRACSADLMPGAVEDEVAELERMSPAELKAELEKARQEFDARLAPASAAEQLSDLQQLHNRLNRQAERIEKLTAECENAKRRLTSLELLEEASVTGNRNYAHDEGARRRIGSVEEHLSERIEALESVVLFIKPQPKRAVDVMREVREREKNAERKAMLDQLTRNHPDMPTCGDPLCGQCYSPKRTIKGGWVNVYREHGGMCSFGGPFAHKSLADAIAETDRCIPRLACIQIPDITEGEGL